MNARKPTFSRRQFLGAASLASLGSSLHPLQESTLATPLGERWPQSSDRYFYGPAADHREMKSAYERARPGDVEGFVAIWTGLAQQKQERAERAAASGRHITARDNFLRASNITHGSRDDIISVGAARKLDAEIRSRQKRIMIVEGAGHHPGNESEIDQIDWLASIL